MSIRAANEVCRHMNCPKCEVSVFEVQCSIRSSKGVGRENRVARDIKNLCIQAPPPALGAHGMEGWPSAGRAFPLPNRKVMLEGALCGVSNCMELSHAEWGANHDRLISVDVAPASAINMDRN